MNDPIELFQQCWAVAKSSNDASANYCSLATATVVGDASIRTLVLRDVIDGAFTLYCDSTSPKWPQLVGNNNLELLVFWPSLMQQFRIKGQCTEIEPETMAGHWRMKPYSSKLLDHFRARYVAQSRVIESRDVLLSGIQALKEQYPKDEDIPFPDNARGVAVAAKCIEFWQEAGPSSLHERNLYTLCDGKWQCEILVP